MIRIKIMSCNQGCSQKNFFEGVKAQKSRLFFNFKADTMSKKIFKTIFQRIFAYIIFSVKKIFETQKSSNNFFLSLGGQDQGSAFSHIGFL